MDPRFIEEINNTVNNVLYQWLQENIEDDEAVMNLADYATEFVHQYGRGDAGIPFNFGLIYSVMLSIFYGHAYNNRILDIPIANDINDNIITIRDEYGYENKDAVIWIIIRARYWTLKNNSVQTRMQTTYETVLEYILRTYYYVQNEV